MIKITKIRDNKKATYAHRYAKSVIVDIEQNNKIFTKFYYCLDHDNNWYVCSSNSEAEYLAGKELSDLLNDAINKV